MYGQYKRLTNTHTSVLTGKGLSFGGSLGRPSATGFGVCYFTQEMLKHMKNTTLEGKTVVVSGSGNVAIYCAQKAMELGSKVVAMSDSNGYIYDAEGIDISIIKDIKEVKRGRIKEYAGRRPGATYTEGCRDIWTIKCDVALPCATQNEIDAKGAQALIDGGVMAVAEGSNMSSTVEAVELLQKAGVLFGPSKAANAGGVAVSGLEMSQNAMRLSWTEAEVDEKLKKIMVDIFHNVYSAAEKFGQKDNLVVGANIAGFMKVADAMKWEGIAY